MNRAQAYAKAYVAAATAALAAVATAAQDGTFTAVEIVTIVLTASVAGVSVWAVPNEDARDTPPSALMKHDIDGASLAEMEKGQR